MSKKKAKPDMNLEFHSEELAEFFHVVLVEEFPTGEFSLEGNRITVFASKKLLTKIKQLSECACYGRRKISIYTPC